MHLNTELLFKKYALPYFKDGMKVLEIGGKGETTFYKAVNNPNVIWHTLDIDLENGSNLFEHNHIVCNKEYEYPFENNTYDIIVSGNVIEHVRKIWVWTKELNRIVKKDGHVITINPVSWPYHLAPIDCWRIYPDGAKALFEDAGFSILLSTFESLELEYFNYSSKLLATAGFTVGDSSLANFSPENYSKGIGYSISKTNKFRIFYNRVLMNFPVLRRMMVPLKVSYDTITIAKK